MLKNYNGNMIRHYGLYGLHDGYNIISSFYNIITSTYKLLNGLLTYKLKCLFIKNYNNVHTAL